VVIYRIWDFVLGIGFGGSVGDRVMTVGIVMTVWNIKAAHRRNLVGTVITMPTVITLSPALKWGAFTHKFD